MDLSQLITSAEKKYKKRLEEFFTEVFSNTNLFSHGIDHHRRVWSFGKEILTQLNRESLNSDNSIPEKLIIICHLHDLGMSADNGIRHGKQSRLFCDR